MPDRKSWIRASAACGECGEPVFFDQLADPETFMAICSEDPEHTIRSAAQQVLDQVRQDNRSD